MKLLKKSLSAMLALIMLLSITAGMEFIAHADSSADFRYALLTDGTACITRYQGKESRVTVPAAIDGYEVSGIGKYAFSEMSAVHSVSLPNSITNIAAYAFYNCVSLSEIEIGNAVLTIGKDAFYGTACYNNQDNWQDGVLYIGNYLISALYNRSDKYTIKNGVIAIADEAFEGKALSEIIIPDSVQSIGYGAFYQCRYLQNIVIPESVIKIGASAFTNTGYYNDLNN